MGIVKVSNTNIQNLELGKGETGEKWLVLISGNSLSRKCLNKKQC